MSGSEGGGDIDANAGAARSAQTRGGQVAGLGSVKDAFVSIASAHGMFGRVPNGQVAEEALERAARGVLEELERAGISLDNVVSNAGEVADLANMTDEEAAFQNRLAAASRPGGGNELLLE